MSFEGEPEYMNRHHEIDEDKQKAIHLSAIELNCRLVEAMLKNPEKIGQKLFQEITRKFLDEICEHAKSLTKEG